MPTGLGVADFEISARQYTSSKRGNTQVQQMKAVEELLQELIRHDDAWPFLAPVDKKLVGCQWCVRFHHSCNTLVGVPLVSLVL